MDTYEPDIKLEPVFSQGLILGGIQRANFLPALFAIGSSIVSGAASLASGAVSAAAGTAGAIASGAASTAGYLGSTAIGAGGTVLGGIGSLGTGIIDTSAGVVSGAGQALFGGQATVPVMTGGEMGSLSQAGGGVFDYLSSDTLGNVAQLGYSLYTSAEERELAEKAIEAQRRAGFVVPGAPGAPVAALSPTTSISIPPSAAGAPIETQDQAKLIKYAIIAGIGFFLFKGVK